MLEQVSLGFGARSIVQGLNLRIGHTDRIGLVGPNGSGKSTLMRMIAGEQSPDDGKLRFSRGLRIGYLSQDLVVRDGQTLSGYVLSSVPGRATLDGALAEAETALAAAEKRATETDAPEDLEALMTAAERISDLHERIQHFDEHYSEHEALRILSGLGFQPGDEKRDLGEFSGGWQMRAVLASLLFQRPDLLLLDEPTNHLDMPSVAWFGAFLKRYGRSFVLVCHDREFLNEQIGRVVSFEPEGVRQFTGDYEAYRKWRAEEELVLENKAKNLKREREKAEQFIERFRAQANKARAVQSRVKALAKMDEVRTFERRKVMRFQFPPCARAGAQVAHLKGLAKRYGEHEVFSDVELRVARGDKIGIIGVNGAGKTTLLKIVAGELEASAGEISFGSKVKVGYFAQHHADKLSAELTVEQEVGSEDPSAGATRVRSLLGAFLFSGEDVDKPVRVLSGGERARVALAKMLIQPGNFLLMDEPTNHLDLESSESLAQSLATFDGTLLFVSHNRSFVRTLATKIWDVSGGRVEVYPGTLDEYLDRNRRLREGDAAAEAELAEARRAAGESSKPGGRSKSSKRPSKQPSKRSGAGSSGQAKSQGPGKRVSAKEQRRRAAQERMARQKKLRPLKKKVEEMEARISTLEDEQRARSTALADPAVYEDEARRGALLSEYQRDADKLEELTARWEIAQGELEEAEAELEEAR